MQGLPERVFQHRVWVGQDTMAVTVTVTQSTVIVAVTTVTQEERGFAPMLLRIWTVGTTRSGMAIILATRIRMQADRTGYVWVQGVCVCVRACVCVCVCVCVCACACGVGCVC